VANKPDARPPRKAKPEPKKAVRKTAATKAPAKSKKKTA
jgi:excinuclease ABC subunit A